MFLSFKKCCKNQTYCNSFFYLELLIYTLIFSHLLLSVTCISQSSIAPLQMVQNTAARLLTKASWCSPITAIIASVCWVQVKFRIHLNITLLTYKALHWLTLAYIRATDFLFLQLSIHIFPFMYLYVGTCILMVSFYSNCDTLSNSVFWKLLYK